jgi:predicted transcriptional regulator YdeE
MSQIIHIPTIKLVGITARTSNLKEFIPTEAQIGKTFGRYVIEDVASKIQNRICAGKTYLAYTDYENDYKGEYTFFIGEEVSSFDHQIFDQLEIQPGTFEKFTTATGKIPDVVLQEWQKIWQLLDVHTPGKRRYATDFEIHHYNDLNQATVDIYIGLKD